MFRRIFLYVFPNDIEGTIQFCYSYSMQYINYVKLYQYYIGLITLLLYALFQNFKLVFYGIFCPKLISVEY